MWQRFTEPARQVILLAQQEAITLKASSVDTEHLLLGLLTDEDTIAARLLAEAGVTRDMVLQELPPGEASLSTKYKLSDSDVEKLREAFKVDTELVRRIETHILKKLRAEKADIELKLSQQAKHVLELGADEARRTNLSYIGPEMLLLGLLRQQDTVARRVLSRAGLSLDTARGLVLEYIRARDADAA